MNLGNNNNNKKKLAAVEAEIKTKLCHQLPIRGWWHSSFQMSTAWWSVIGGDAFGCQQDRKLTPRSRNNTETPSPGIIGSRVSLPASRWRCWPSSKSSWSGVVFLFKKKFFLTKPARLPWLSRLLIRFYLTADSKTEAPSVLLLLNPIRQMWRPCKSPRDGKIE